MIAKSLVTVNGQQNVPMLITC